MSTMSPLRTSLVISFGVLFLMGEAALSARRLLCCLTWLYALCAHPRSVTRFKLVYEEQTTGPLNTQGFKTVVLKFYYASE